MPYEIEWSDEARASMRQIPVFTRGPVFAAVERLRHQAEFETRNRKPISAPIEEMPEAAWEARVAGSYRVLYRIDEGQTVRILRVILKGTRTTREAVGRSQKP